jgi:hypothetical protein
MLLSATISLFDEALIGLSIGVILFGVVAMFIWIVFIQRKFNGGMFG